MLKSSFLPVISRITALLFVILTLSTAVYAQEIDILIKGGHVIDPKNRIDSKMDVAIAGGKIARVAKDIPAAGAKKVVDATGLYVVPGLIDLHAHVFVGTGQSFADGFPCISPDDITLKAGITTVVDAGTSGWRNFPQFKKQVIDRSTTRVLSFINIAGGGMTGFPSEEDINDMDPHMTSLVIGQYPEIIVGVKIGHFSGSDWTPFDRAVEAAGAGKVPLFVECHLPKYPLGEMLKRMRPGDIHSHSFCAPADRECILDESGKVRDYVWEAEKRGIRFDAGHGGAMFHFDVAYPALKQGFLPNSFGTDLHRFSINSGMKDMLNFMSKYMALGMSLQDVVYRATWNSALSIKREDLGNLGEGAVADIAVLNVKKGRFGFIDTNGKRLEGSEKLENELTVRAGRIVFDLNGIGAEQWQKK